ncbi:MAG: hypothetical protein LBP61_07625 [Desulfovibrio sp.]|jgi:hypothetical protein|nr:hypothetical protein [Desulfovibrio sp.]
MASSPSPQAESLARRYPLLRSVPPEQRSRVLRAAILNPLILGIILSFTLLAMPPYMDITFRLLDVNREANFALKAGKIILLTLPPMSLALFLLTRFLLPLSLRRVMRKRGFDPDAAPAEEARKRPSPSASPPRWKKKKRPKDQDAP